jgi:hypothetical protein
VLRLQRLGTLLNLGCVVLDVERSGDSTLKRSGSLHRWRRGYGPVLRTSESGYAPYLEEPRVGKIRVRKLNCKGEHPNGKVSLDPAPSTGG